MRRYAFILISLAFVVFSMWPTIYEIGRQHDIQPNRTFELVHNFYTDFNFYLSRIRQGLEGNLTVHEKYTSEPHQGSFIHVFYLMLGWMGKYVGVPWHRTADIYHMARVVLAITWLLMIAQVAKRSFAKFGWQIMAFLFAVTASTYHIIVHMDDGSLRFGGFMPWWSVMDSLQRITFIPHLLAGQALMVFLIYAITNRETIRRPRNWIFLGILGFILGLILPPALTFVYAIMPMAVIIDFLLLKPKPAAKQIFPWVINRSIPLIAVAIISSPSLLYLLLMTSFFPWKQLALADIQHPLPYNFWEYMQAMGDILPLGLAGGIIAVRQREKAMILPLVWVITWGMLLWIFKYVPSQSPLRFSEMIVHVPLAMLATYLFMQIFNYGAGVSSLFGDVRRSLSGKMPGDQTGLIEDSPPKSFNKIITALYRIFSAPHKVSHRRLGGASIVMLSLIIPVILIALNLFHMYSSWLWQRDFVIHKIVAMYPLVPTGSYVMYPLTDFVQAIVWIQDHTTRDTVILSETTAGNYIPVYAGNYVYVGHDNTVNSEEKKMFVKSFFSGTMPMDQAQKWLAQENLHWVFFGPQEKEDSAGVDLAQFYPFLEVGYQGEYVTVYHVK